MPLNKAQSKTWKTMATITDPKKKPVEDEEAWTEEELMSGDDDDDSSYYVTDDEDEEEYEDVTESSAIAEMLVHNQEQLAQQMQADKELMTEQFNDLFQEMKNLKKKVKKQRRASLACGENLDKNDVSESAETYSSLSTEEAVKMKKELLSLHKEVDVIKKTSAASLRVLQKELKRSRKESTAAKKEAAAIKSALMETLREEIDAVRTSAMQEVEEMRKQLNEAKAEISSLRLQSKGSAEDSAVSPRVQNTPVQRKESPKTVLADLTSDMSAPPLTPKTPKTPKKKVPKAARTFVSFPDLIHPHSFEDLAKAQRKDKVLSGFVENQEGLPFDFKSLSKIREFSEASGKTRSLFLFEQRAYIPKKLRTATLEYLTKIHGDNARNILKERYIWPNCEEDLLQYRTESV